MLIDRWTVIREKFERVKNAFIYLASRRMYGTTYKYLILRTYRTRNTYY